jgi:DNA topoisomerase-3
VYQEADEEDKDKNADENMTLPIINIGDISNCNKADIQEKKTKPPLHYTDDTLLSTMENPAGLINDDDLKAAIKDHGIGTPATRAAIIETLIRRDYIRRDKKNVIATQMGKDLINSIDIELLKSPVLTADWEYTLERIADGIYTKREFMTKTIDFVNEGISHVTTSNSMNIEKNSFDIITLGKCPKCKIGDIKENKSGYGCSCYNNAESPCSFFVSATILGKKITAAQIKKLIKHGKTDVIKGFVSKNDKMFDAAIAFDDNYKTTFKF